MTTCSSFKNNIGMLFTSFMLSSVCSLELLILILSFVAAELYDFDDEKVKMTHDTLFYLWQLFVLLCINLLSPFPVLSI